MGQVLHGSARTAAAVRRAIQKFTDKININHVKAIQSEYIILESVSMHTLLENLLDEILWEDDFTLFDCKKLLEDASLKSTQA